MSVLFPKHHNALIVFENPVYQNCYLDIGAKNFPNENFDTMDVRFFENLFTAVDLDVISLQYTEKFEYSFTMPKKDIERTRYKKILRNVASFVFNVQTERERWWYKYKSIVNQFIQEGMIHIIMSMMKANELFESPMNNNFIYANEII